MFLPPASLVRASPPRSASIRLAAITGVVHDPPRGHGGVAGTPAFLHRRRPGALLPDDAQRRLARRRPCLQPAHGGQVHRTARPARPAHLRGWGGTSTRPTRQPRRVVSYWLLRHTFHRHSIWLDLRPRATSSCWLTACTDGGRPALTPLRAKVATVVAAALGAATTAPRSLVSMCCGARLSAAPGKACRPHHQPDRRGPPGRRNVDLMRAAGVPWLRCSRRARARGREDRPVFPTYDAAPASESSACMARRCGQRLRCCAASTRWSSISRTWRALLHLRDHHGVRHGSGGQAGIRTMCSTGQTPSRDARGRPAAGRANQSFVGYFPGLPVRHGMTMGELARSSTRRTRLARAYRDPDGGWNRATGSRYGPRVARPLPNLRSLNAATLYPACASGSFQKILGGPRNGCPFEQIGRFHRRPRAGAYLNRREIPGVRVYPTHVGAVEVCDW